MRKGFTLVELMVVLAIIAIMIGLSAAAFQSSRQSARDTKRQSDLEEIRSGLEIYRTDCGDYPATTYTTDWPAEVRGDGTPATCAVTNVYLRPPEDPISPVRYYRYWSNGVNYELCAPLENVTGTESCGDSNDCGETCNYKVENP